MGKDDPEYYPFRWKVADAVEDLFVLHRRKLIAGTLLVLGAVAVILFVVNGGDDDVQTTDSGTTTTVVETSTPSTTETVDASSSSSSTASSSTSSSTTTEGTTSTTTTTTEVPSTTTTTQSTRPVPTPEQIAATQPGSIIEMSPEAIRLVGGLPSDVVANETIRVAEQVFPDAEVLDQQIVDPSFPSPDKLVFRLSAADLFGYNSDDINAAYLPLIDQLAATMLEAEFWTVQVTGHTDSSGPADGNQRLSERRAQSGADRLIEQGVSTDRITVVGAGETEPIASNATQEGQLANRRIEFVVSSA